VVLIFVCSDNPQASEARKKSVISQRERGGASNGMRGHDEQQESMFSYISSRSEFPWIIRCGACER